MIRQIRKFVKKYPEQAFLFLFNTGIFAWLQTTGLMIANKLGVQLQVVQELIPEWLRLLVGNSVSSLQTYFGSGAVSWLVISMVLTVVIRFITGIVKNIILILIILIGLYLVIKNYTILTQLI
ncbi:hypothetical protein [Streptococcus saliviloxodontae]|uniref:Uncharacterized protein n=1 Tax=Streptococcus saliviloxodontae TaxID=1349416 RepID=A0ABS2PMF0_9STRE|nr:hypothetical protein [Streptococcus saliviloxodontae]MBM7636615.1 hypothetical protein [Streptococcus saliviloxodontae]